MVTVLHKKKFPKLSSKMQAGFANKAPGASFTKLIYVFGASFVDFLL
jgi:hypothetical protein